MTAALPESHAVTGSTELVSIESIKKAFIRLNEGMAANEAVNLPLASESQVESIKRAIAPLEFHYKTKVQVVVGAVGGLNQSSPAQIQDGQVKLLANLIANDKQAQDAYLLGVRGLLAMPLYLKGLGSRVVQSIYDGLDEEQLNTLKNISSIESLEDPVMVVETYLSYLASLNISLSFFDRRNSWQRGWVRKFYPQLQWTAEDLQYLIFKAVNKWIKHQAKTKQKN